MSKLFWIFWRLNCQIIHIILPNVLNINDIMKIKNVFVCIKVVTNSHFSLILWLYFYSLIQSGSGFNFLNLKK
jgi:hypothetical protein